MILKCQLFRCLEINRLPLALRSTRVLKSTSKQPPGNEKGLTKGLPMLPGVQRPFDQTVRRRLQTHLKVRKEGESIRTPLLHRLVYVHILLPPIPQEFPCTYIAQKKMTDILYDARYRILWYPPRMTVTIVQLMLGYSLAHLRIHGLDRYGLLLFVSFTLCIFIFASAHAIIRS